MECKVSYATPQQKASGVLIETLWNVKLDEKIEDVENMAVLIETLWNVKIGLFEAIRFAECINRNIVECKVQICAGLDGSAGVLIETLWNVKSIFLLYDRECSLY